MEHKGKTYKILFPDLFRPHSGSEAAAFHTSVQELGITVPIVVDESDGLIDGEQRLRKAAELDIPCPLLRVKDMTRGEKRILAETLNSNRRQLSMQELKQRRESRLEVVAREREQRHSLRVIADRVGVSPEQVRLDLEEIEKRTGKDPSPDEVIGKDNVERPARTAKPSTVDSKNGNGKAREPDEPKPDVLVDRLGTPVPRKLRDAAADTWHTGASDTLARIAKEAKGVLRWSKYLDASVIATIKEAAEKIGAAAFDHVHAECEGKGCADCLMSGYKTEGK